MNRKIKTIRDLPLIEQELNSSPAGVISITLLKGGFSQFATNFIYQNKNIFVYLNNEDLLRTIKLDALARFTILKDKNVTSEMTNEPEPLYRLFSIVITGLFREAEEKKTIKEIDQSFIEKYSGKLLLPGKDLQSNGKLYFIDSEELLAFDEIGY